MIASPNDTAGCKNAAGPRKTGVGRCERIGRATARSHSRLGKLFRNKELFPDLKRKSDRGKMPQVPAKSAVARRYGAVLFRCGSR
jgi:hypothetical protein